MPELSIPEINITVKDFTAIPYRKRPGFIVADRLGDTTTLGMGDTQGLSMEGTNPTISDDWLSSGIESSSWYPPQNVTFYRFLKDGVFREGSSAQSSDPNSDLFGLALTGRLAFLDSKVNDTPLEGVGFTDLNWEDVQGTWESVKPPGAPQFLKVRNVSSGPTQKIRTVGNIPANRSIYGEVNFVAKGGTPNQAAARFQWGASGDGQLSLCWRHGQKITIEKMEGGKWKVVRALDMEVANLKGGRYVFKVRRLAGRLCVSINERNFHHVFIEATPNSKPKPVDATWGAGKLQFNCFNVRGTLGVGVIKYSSSSDTVMTGSFNRSIRKSVPLRDDEIESPPDVKFKGWQRDGTLIDATATFFQWEIRYGAVLYGSPQGIDTPFVSTAMIRCAPEWTDPDSGSVDLRPALSNMRVTLPSIPSAPYSEVQIQVSRLILDVLVPDWEDYVQRYHPIEIEARRKYDDGTYYDLTPRKLFKGYIYKIDKATNGVNDLSMTLTCRDESVRLQKPAAVIDHRFPPMDILFAYATASDPLSLALYGEDAVREILRRSVGDAPADDMVAYFSDHYPLLDFYGDTGGFINVQSAITGQPPTSGAWFFPAPYGDDAMTWITGTFAKHDKAVFYYGWPAGVQTDWPVPIYGRIPQIIAAMPAAIEIPDSLYLDGDKEKLLLQVSTETRPDRDINRVLAWANFQGQNALEDFMPATRMAVDQLEMPDINAAERSWERTLVIREDFGAVEGGAEAIATGVTMLLGNSEMKWPNFLTRGNPALQWGQTVTFKMISTTSDQSIHLDGTTFRCERVEHVFDLTLSNADCWTTSVAARPTSRGIF